MIAWKKIGWFPRITSRTSRPLYVSSNCPIMPSRVICFAFLISHLSQSPTSSPSRSFTLATAPGSGHYMDGTAKFKKQFLNSSSLHPFRILTNSSACRPAIEAVVVASAGTILPAFNFTVIQSLISSL